MDGYFYFSMLPLPTLKKHFSCLQFTGYRKYIGYRIRYRVPVQDTLYRMQNAECRIHDTRFSCRRAEARYTIFIAGYMMQNTRYMLPDTKCMMQETWMQDAGYTKMDTGYIIQDIGCALQDTGVLMNGTHSCYKM
jgi:hypothetical protein